MNELLFFIHAAMILGSTLFALWMGKEALIAFVGLTGILANLFVLKQIQLFGLNVTASDAYIIAGIVGLNLLQEYHGKQSARKAIAVSFALSIFYVGIAQLHLLFTPSPFDSGHTHYQALLSPMPRIIAASVVTYFLAQLLDYRLFGILKKMFRGKNLALRNGVSLMITQLFDTALFSFAGLYGLVASVTHVMIFSYGMKMIVIMLAAPFVVFSRRLIRNDIQPAVRDEDAPQVFQQDSARSAVHQSERN